jgi:hypothetical protein
MKTTNSVQNQQVTFSKKLSTGGGVKLSNTLVINNLRTLFIGLFALFSFNTASSQCSALLFTTVTFGWTISSGSPVYTGVYRIPIGQTLVIDGPLTNVTFSGLQLQMEKGARIELRNGATLNIIPNISTNSRLYNCSIDAWDCILITSSTSTLTVDNSIIEGSDFGIRNIAGGNTTLTNARLFNNYNHFQLLISTLTTTTIMDGSLFICNPTTLSPMPVSTVFPSNPRTLSAIQLTNAGAVILGSGSTGLNTIINADLGIDIYNTSAEIYNFLIRDCDDRTPSIEGGIYARNPALGGFLNYIIVGGFSANEPVSIYNSELGIRASLGYNVKVYNNYLEDIQKHGISAFNNTFPNVIDIQENTLVMNYITTITAPMAGIYSLENKYGSVTISKNTVRLNGMVTGSISASQEAYGIRADEDVPSNSALVKILGNEVYDFSIGIRVGNTRLAEINSDSVTIPNSSDIRRGIYTVNNEDLSIIKNRVLSDTTVYNPLHRGINTQSSATPSGFITCNRVWNGGRQYFLQNTVLNGTDGFMGNGMRHNLTAGSAHTGLVLSISNIGTNGNSAIPSDNHWQTPFVAWCVNNPTGFGNIFQRTNVGSDVFDPFGAGCLTGVPITPTLSLSTPAFICAGELMREAEDEPLDPSLLITYENAATFISSLKNKSYQTIWDLQNAASLFSLDIIPDNDSLVTIFSEFPFAEDALLMENINNLMSNSDFDQAIELLQSHTWELEGFAYQAWMNILIITNPKDAEGNYDDSTIETLTNIANLCPYIYGSAVFEARTKLQWGDSEESEACDAASLNPESYLKYGFGNMLNKQTKISISPQPVEQGTELTLSVIASDISVVKVLSLQGTNLWSLQPIDTIKSIKIKADFQPGIYLLQITLNTGETQVKKIVIQ